MIKENEIAKRYEVSKSKLIDLRMSGKYVEGKHWQRLNPTAMRPGAVWWTEEGVGMLSSELGLRIEPEQPSKKTVEVEKVVEKEKFVETPGIIRQKFPNRRLLRVEVRGKPEIVNVKDSIMLRIGQIISVFERGGKLYANVSPKELLKAKVNAKKEVK